MTRTDFRYAAVGATILVDNGEFKTNDQVEHVTTPHRIDVFFYAGLRSVGMECKFPEDLYTSIRTRRLARQVRTLQQACDVAVVMHRGPWPGHLKVPKMDPHNPHKIMKINNRPVLVNKPIEECLDLWAELARLQALGVYVLQGPADDTDLLAWLDIYRPTFAGARTVLHAIAGTDRTTSSDGQPGHLLRNISGIGKTVSQNLHNRYGSTWEVFEKSHDGTLVAAKNVIRNIKDALK